MDFETLINNLLEERNRAIAELRSMYDDAEKRDGDEKGVLSGEEREKEARIHETVKDLDERIMRASEMLKRQRESADALNELNLPDPSGDGGNPPANPEENRSETDRLDAWLRADDDESRSMPAGFDLTIPSESRDDVALGTTTATDGAELVATEMHTQLWEHMVHESPILSTNVTVMRTSKGNDIDLPRTTSYSAAGLVAEAGGINRSAPQTDDVTIRAHKIGFIVEVNRELLEDSAFNVVEFVLRQGGAALGRGANTYFVTGAGTTEPQGIDNATASGQTVPVAGAADMDFLVNTMHSVIAPARAGASWLFHDTVSAGLMRLKDADDRYLWQPSHQAGKPDMLLGKPALTDPNLSDQAGEVVGVFGNFAGFYVRQAGGFRIERSDHANWGNDQVSFRFLTRIDSVILDDTAFRTIEGS